MHKPVETVYSEQLLDGETCQLSGDDDHVLEFCILVAAAAISRKTLATSSASWRRKDNLNRLLDVFLLIDCAEC